MYYQFATPVPALEPPRLSRTVAPKWSYTVAVPAAIMDNTRGQA